MCITAASTCAWDLDAPLPVKTAWRTDSISSHRMPSVDTMLGRTAPTFSSLQRVQSCFLLRSWRMDEVDPRNSSGAGKGYLKTLLNIALLIFKAWRSTKLREDGPEALQIYREARDITLPWLEDAENELQRHGLLGNSIRKSDRRQSSPSKGSTSGTPSAANSVGASPRDYQQRRSSRRLGMLKQVHAVIRSALKDAEDEIGRLEHLVEGRHQHRRRRRRAEQPQVFDEGISGNSQPSGLQVPNEEELLGTASKFRSMARKGTTPESFAQHAVAEPPPQQDAGIESNVVQSKHPFATPEATTRTKDWKSPKPTPRVTQSKPYVSTLPTAPRASSVATTEAPSRSMAPYAESVPESSGSHDHSNSRARLQPPASQHFFKSMSRPVLSQDCASPAPQPMSQPPSRVSFAMSDQRSEYRQYPESRPTMWQRAGPGPDEGFSAYRQPRMAAVARHDQQSRMSPVPVVGVHSRRPPASSLSSTPINGSPKTSVSPAYREGMLMHDGHRQEGQNNECGKASRCNRSSRESSAPSRRPENNAQDHAGIANPIPATTPKGPHSTTSMPQPGWAAQQESPRSHTRGSIRPTSGSRKTSVAPSSTIKARVASVESKPVPQPAPWPQQGGPSPWQENRQGPPRVYVSPASPPESIHPRTSSHKGRQSRSNAYSAQRDPISGRASTVGSEWSRSSNAVPKPAAPEHLHAPQEPANRPAKAPASVKSRTSNHKSKFGSRNASRQTVPRASMQREQQKTSRFSRTSSAARDGGACSEIIMQGFQKPSGRRECHHDPTESDCSSLASSEGSST